MRLRPGVRVGRGEHRRLLRQHLQAGLLGQGDQSLCGEAGHAHRLAHEGGVDVLHVQRHGGQDQVPTGLQQPHQVPYEVRLLLPVQLEQGEVHADGVERGVRQGYVADVGAPEGGGRHLPCGQLHHDRGDVDAQHLVSGLRECLGGGPSRAAAHVQHPAARREPRQQPLQ